MKLWFVVLAVLVLWCTEVTAAGQVFLANSSCADTSSAEACMRSFKLKIRKIPDEQLAQKEVKLYIMAWLPDDTWWMFTPQGWSQYTDGPVTPYSIGVIDKDHWVELLGNGADVSGLVGARVAVGYGLAAGSANGPAWDDMILRRTHEWVYHLRPDIVNSTKEFSSIVTRGSGVSGGSVQIIGDTLSESAVSFVPIGQTVVVRVNPPSPPVGFRVQTTLLINDIVAHAMCRPNAKWYGVEPHECYFTSYQRAADRLEVNFALE